MCVTVCVHGGGACVYLRLREGGFDADAPPWLRRWQEANLGQGQLARQTHTLLGQELLLILVQKQLLIGGLRGLLGLTRTDSTVTQRQTSIQTLLTLRDRPAYRLY